MPTFPRPLVLLLLVVLAMGVVVAFGYADETHKQAAMNRLELHQWYCVHRGVQCGAGDPDRIERRWNERELGYQAALVALACGATGLLISLRRRR